MSSKRTLASCVCYVNCACCGYCVCSQHNTNYIKTLAAVSRPLAIFSPTKSQNRAKYVNLRIAPPYTLTTPTPPPRAFPLPPCYLPIATLPISWTTEYMRLNKPRNKKNLPVGCSIIQRHRAGWFSTSLAYSLFPLLVVCACCKYQISNLLTAVS